MGACEVCGRLCLTPHEDITCQKCEVRDCSKGCCPCVCHAGVDVDKAFEEYEDMRDRGQG